MALSVSRQEHRQGGLRLARALLAGRRCLERRHLGPAVRERPSPKELPARHLQRPSPTSHLGGLLKLIILIATALTALLVAGFYDGNIASANTNHDATLAVAPAAPT